VKDRDGSKLGVYFAVVPGLWALEIVLLLLIAAYVAGLLILTSKRVRISRRVLPIGIGFGAVTAGVLYALAPLGANVDPATPSAKWWGLAALALPLATGFLAARVTAGDERPGTDPVQYGAQRGCLAATCAMATSALLLAVLTSATIALFPQHVPLQNPPPPPGGGCETCDSSAVIPPGLRHEYWAELSVGQAGGIPFAALLLVPFLGAGLGSLAGDSPANRLAPVATVPATRTLLRRLSRSAASWPRTPPARRSPTCSKMG